MPPLMGARPPMGNPGSATECHYSKGSGIKTILYCAMQLLYEMQKHFPYLPMASIVCFMRLKGPLQPMCLMPYIYMQVQLQPYHHAKMTLVNAGRTGLGFQTN